MSDKVTPRILQGFAELLPKEQILFNSIYDKIRSVYEKYPVAEYDAELINLSDENRSFHTMLCRCSVSGGRGGFI